MGAEQQGVGMGGSALPLNLAYFLGTSVEQQQLSCSVHLANFHRHGR